MTLIAYWPVFHAGFVDYDDPEYVVSNPHVQAGLTWGGITWAMHSYYASNWHPLTWVSHMLDVQLFGPGPMGPHCVNLLLHVANAMLLFLLLRRMTGAQWRSALVAALFALHPVHVESVAWVSERKDVLSTFFGLLTLMAYVGFADPRKGSGRGPKVCYRLALLLFVLALMSKPMMVTLPFVMLLLDFWPLKRLPIPNRKTYGEWGRVILEKSPFFLLTALTCWATVAAQQGSIQPLYNLPIESRVENALVAYIQYLGKIFWPTRLAVPYLHESQWPLTTVMLAFVVVAGITLGLIWIAPKHRFVATGWFWFLGTLIPVIGLLQVGIQSMADRYTYVPAIGIFIIVAWGAAKIGERGRVLGIAIGVAAVLALGVCTVLARRQAVYWQSTEQLFSHSAAVTENNYVALTSVGLARFHDGKFEEATNYYYRALDIHPAYTDAMNNMGVALVGRDDNASIAWYRRALAQKPRDVRTLYNLATELANVGRNVEARQTFETVLGIDPEHFETLNNLGNVLAELGRIDEALACYRRALQLQPLNRKAIENMALVLLKHGKGGEAVGLYRRLIKASPNDAPAHYSLGLALAVDSQWDEAIHEYLEAARLMPGNSEVEYNLGYAYRVQKRFGEAAQHLETAVRLRADFPMAHYNLGCVLADSGHPDEAVLQLKEALREKPDYQEAEAELQGLNDLKTK